MAVVAQLPAPPYEYADDPRAYRAERATYLHARALGKLLLRATGAHGELPTYEPTRATYEAHAAAVAHFAGIARRARVGWRPSRLIERAMAARGVTLAEVLEAAR